MRHTFRVALSIASLLLIIRSGIAQTRPPATLVPAPLVPAPLVPAPPAPAAEQGQPPPPGAAQIKAQALQDPQHELPWQSIASLRQSGDEQALNDTLQSLTDANASNSPAYLQLRVEQLRLDVKREDVNSLDAHLREIAPAAENMGPQTRAVINTLYTEAPARGEPDDPPFSELEVARLVETHLGAMLHSNAEYLLNLATTEINNTGGDPKKARALLDEAKPLLPGGRSAAQFRWLWTSVRTDTERGTVLVAQDELKQLKQYADHPTDEEREWATLLMKRGDIPWMYKEIVRKGEEIARKNRVVENAIANSVALLGKDALNARGAAGSATQPAAVAVAASSKNLPAASSDAAVAGATISKSTIPAHRTRTALLALVGVGVIAALFGTGMLTRGRRMHGTLLCLLGVGVAIAAAVPAVANWRSIRPPQLNYQQIGDLQFTPVIEFGQAPEGAFLSGNATFNNPTTNNRTLRFYKKDCGCTSVPLVVNVPANSWSTVPVGLTTNGKHGDVEVKFILADADQPENMYVVSLRSNITPAVMTPIKHRLEQTTPGRAVRVPVELIAGVSGGWRIDRAQGNKPSNDPHNVGVTVDQQTANGFVIEVVTPRAVGDYHGTYVATIVSDSGQKFDIIGRVSGNVNNPLFAEQGEIALGVYSKQLKQAVTREIVASVANLSLKDFELPKSLSAQIVTGQDGKAHLKLSYAPTDAIVGPVREDIRVHVPTGDIVIPVKVTVTD